MVAVLVRRPPRDVAPPPQRRARSLAPVPIAAGTGGGFANAMQVLLPALGGLGMVMFLVANGNPIFLLAGVVMLVATLGGGGALFVTRNTGARRQLRTTRDRYLAYLEEQRSALRDTARAQAEHAARAHPDPVTLTGLVRVPGRVFERRPGDPDFLQARVGIGQVPLVEQVVLPPAGSPLDVQDAVCRNAALAVVAGARTVTDQPLTVDLATTESVTLVGASDEVRAVARALLAQVLAQHAPQEVGLAVLAPDPAPWEWLRWVPQLGDPAERDGVLPRRRAARDRAGLAAEMSATLSARLDEALHARRLGGTAEPRGRLVVVVDELDTGPSGPVTTGESGVRLAELGVVVVRLVADPDDEPDAVDVRVVVRDGRVQIGSPVPGAPQVSGSADLLGAADAEALARELAPLRVVADEVVEEPLTSTADLADLLGLPDIAALDVARGWAPRAMRDFLRVPIGVRSDGTPLMLDLKESAHGGMGPHGLCVGATGSGKSEMLRTLVLALAATHPPDRLSFVLVDFKGGATFAGLEPLPHVAGTITNLSGDLGLVDRVRDALVGELTRRQSVLMAAGNLPNITEYNARRDRGADLEPLPDLVVVVDEFAELLTARPDFLDLFTQVGRIGRSVGVHQLLASQRLEEGRLRGLESFLSYRLGLRTFNAEESRTVLGVPDAFTLPPVPGSGYLKVDTTVFTRFKGAYVSSPYVEPSSAPVVAPPVLHPFALLNSGPVGGVPAPADGEPDDRAAAAAVDAAAEAGAGAPTVLDVAVGVLAGAAPRTHQVWLPPLAPQIPLSDVVPPGDGSAAPPADLAFAVGVVDRPTEQRTEPLLVDLAGWAGHLALVGAPRSGKSTALRTLVLSAAARQPPGAVAFHCVDLGGGSLASIADLPHVGTVAGRLDMDRVRRVFAHVEAELETREQLFAAERLDSAEAMRRRWRAGGLPALAAADLVLVLDGYGTVKNDHDDLHDQLVQIATRGLAYGVHVVLTAARWYDLRPALQTAVGGRVELRLNDPLDSAIDRKLAANIRTDRPGQALVEGGLGQICLPRLDGRTGTDDLAEALADAAGQLRDRWRGWPAVEQVRLLPERVAAKDLAEADADEPGAPGGIAGGWSGRLHLPFALGEDLRPVRLDLLGGDPHLLVFGDQGSGKSTVLRTVVDAIVRDTGEDDAVFAVVDPRRSLLGFVPEAQLGAYAPTAAAAGGLAQSLAAELKGRLPGNDVTIQQLQERSWWSGPEIVVVVDDLDLVVTSEGNPLTPLLPYLPQARDLGLHLLVTRHSGGASRAVFEPFLQRLRELGATGLVLSGDRTEGQLWPGATPSRQPPGRGTFVRRGQRPRPVQVAVTDAAEAGGD